MRMKYRAFGILCAFCTAIIACDPEIGPPDFDVHTALDAFEFDTPDIITTQNDVKQDASGEVRPADCCVTDEGMGPDVVEDAADTGAGDSGGWDDDVNVDPDAVVVTDLFLDAAVDDNPYSGLSAVVTFTTSKPAIASLVVDIAGGPPLIVPSGETSPALEHSVYVVGLLPETSYRMYPRAADGGQVKLAEDFLEYTTEAIPDDFPELTLTASDPERMHAGYTVFSVHKMDLQNPGSTTFDFEPRVITVDGAGRIVGYTKWTNPDARLLGFNMLSNGNIALLGSFGLVVMDGRGAPVFEKSLADLGLDGASDLQDSFLHHDVILLPDGNYAAIGTKLVPMASTPAVNNDAIIVDQVIEFTPSGQIVSKRPLDAYIDYTEENAQYGNDMWNKFYPGWLTHDNMHVNSLLYDPSDDSIIVGLHASGRLLKYSRANGEMVWIIGDPNGEQTLDDKFLPMKGDGTWFTSSHGPSLTEDGHLLTYDNGALLNREQSKKSRVVEYEIDSHGGSARFGVYEVWQYRNDFYSHIMGSAQRLSNGNTLMCNGFRIPSFENFVLEPSITEVTGGDNPEVVFNLQMATQDMDFSTSKYMIFRAFRVDTLYNWF